MTDELDSLATAINTIGLVAKEKGTHGEEFGWVLRAAKEFLTIKEAGALIITPDENGEWPEWALVPTYTIVNNEEGFPSIVPHKAKYQLDALRDAMPDGGGE